MPSKKSRKTAAAAKSRKPAARRAPARVASRKKPAPRAAKTPAAAKPAAASAASREVVALKAKLEREKTGFEKRLTETMREIATLRHHEARAAQLERQLKERDELIIQLRTQLNDLRNREVVTPDDEELQPSLALGSRGSDYDEFDDDVGPEDDELI